MANKNHQKTTNSMSKSPNQASDWESTRFRAKLAGGQYPNPLEISNPDPATLREQWRFAIRQYSKWYSHAWGTAILAGVSFFALGWLIKGSNPLPSFSTPKQQDRDQDQSQSHRPKE